MLRHHCQTLIDGAELERRIVDTRTGPVLLDCRHDLTDPSAGRRAFAAGHLPNARHLDLNTDLSGPLTEHSGRHPLPTPRTLASRLAALGITPATEVICYDAGDGSFAARAWWLLRWMGHAAVAVLDGGFAAWQAAGRHVAHGEGTPPVPASPLPLRPPLERHVDTAAVARDLDSNRWLLVDARAPERFRGEHEPIDPVAGHIPGAINRPFTANLHGGHFKPARQLAAEWQALLSGRATQDVIVYCGSGVTACHHVLALAHAGLPGARLYAGSWSAWCGDATRPVAKGA
ncbi:sulfurtransferase [Immundisolibacter sp.]|uniref:sulfurtransferase n=1 Tax=Immundisolibacter sp. TaxID=1934948 RepID=UPI00356A55B9